MFLKGTPIILDAAGPFVRGCDFWGPGDRLQAGHGKAEARQLGELTDFWVRGCYRLAAIARVKTVWHQSYLEVMDQNVPGLPADPPDSLWAYIRNGRIVAVPAKRTRRLLLLDWVAQAFEPGRQYPEPVVDEVLKSIFDDHCALRRYLVDESFMSRTAAGVYWRAGGTVDA